jgi:hypothetical protein
LIKADWMNMPKISLSNGLNLYINVWVKPGLHYPVLGVPDSYADETCLTAMGNLSRAFKDNGA